MDVDDLNESEKESLRNTAQGFVFYDIINFFFLFGLQIISIPCNNLNRKIKLYTFFSSHERKCSFPIRLWLIFFFVLL